MSENNSGSMMAGFLIGATVGAGLALIFAPMAGNESRRQLKRAARNLKDGARDQVDQIGGFMHRVKDGVEEVGSAIEASMDGASASATPTGLRR